MILALSFLFVILSFPYWKMLSSPSKGEVSPSSCSSGGDCDEEAEPHFWQYLTATEEHPWLQWTPLIQAALTCE